MKYGYTLSDENQKVLNIVKSEFVKLDFSELSSLSSTNWCEPNYMDTYVLLYKAALPADITIYNIILEKLSQKIFLFSYNKPEFSYVSLANELMVRAYVRYLINGEPIKYFIKSKYLPNKEYCREIIRVDKFSDCGVNVVHDSKNKFTINPINISFENIEQAKATYDDLLDLNAFYKDVNIDRNIMLSNYSDVLKLSKDKRLLATLSNIKTYFNCPFSMKDGCIVFEGNGFMIKDEKSAMAFQSKLIDAYHFYRNVINTKDKKDLISEIYNQKVSPEIRQDFINNATSYLNIIQNGDLIDWIVTISRESNYTLSITYDSQGVFYIDGAIIMTALDAKEYYIDYMDSKKEKLAMVIYKNNILGKIKRIWNKFRARFAKA